MTLSNTRRYSLQGGGPALGALYGAVNASPSTDAGQPLSLYALTSASSVGPSLTISTVPSKTRSIPGRLTEIDALGLAPRSLDFLVPSPLVKYSSPPYQRAATPAACGRPFAPAVPRNQVMCAFGSIASSTACGRVHGRTASP